MTALFSYVVDHDHGYAPNPHGGICTLVHCKFGGVDGRRNVVESAEVGDWVIGSGGASRQSAGNGNIIYLMRVDEKLDFEEYLSDARFIGRDDHADWGNGNRFALVSFHYFYFGKNALSKTALPSLLPIDRLFKKGPGFRRDFPSASLKSLVGWFDRTFEIGMHGYPCAAKRGVLRPRLRATRRCCRPALPPLRCGKVGG